MQTDLAILLAATDFRDPLLPLWAMELLANVFLYVWLFCVGATVGSFLNVVVYRLPRGKNLAYPGSCCPHCGHSIRSHDNIPLLSWLNLRGRCRDCGGPIAPRYFFVELTIACIFLIVLLAEHYLPSLAFGFRTRHLLTVRDGVPFWCLYFLHVSLVTTLIGAILIHADHFPVPASLFLPIALVGFTLPLLWPEIRSLPALDNPSSTGWQAGLIDGLGGLIAGLLVGILLIPLARRRKWPPSTALALCCSVAIVLGWQRGLFASPLALPICDLAALLLTKISTRLPLQAPTPEQRPANDLESPPSDVDTIAPTSPLDSPSP